MLAVYCDLLILISGIGCGVGFGDGKGLGPMISLQKAQLLWASVSEGPVVRVPCELEVSPKP